MKRIILMLLIALLPAAALAGTPNPRYTGPEGPLNKLRQEVAAAKLDRLLNLTRDQARALAPVLGEAVQLEDQLRAEHEKRRPEIAKALAAVRDDYLHLGQVSDASRKALQEARGDFALKDLHERMRGLHQRLKAILTPDQKSRLHAFNPAPLQGLEGDGSFEGMGPGAGKHRGERGPKPGKVMRIAMSPEFSTLVEARAR